MPSNKGYINEQLIVEAINEKKFHEINRNLQTMIRDGFGYIEDDEMIIATKEDGIYKPDIAITCKGVTKYVSIKEGRAEMVHGESIKTFVPFLRELGISKDTLKTILLFHFGDGTMDGTGYKRLSDYKVNQWLNERIKVANRELNRDHDLIEKFLKRVLYQGLDPNAHTVDFIYFGTPEYGTTVSKKQISTHVRKKNWQYFDRLHIGPIFFKPHARYSDKPITSEERRMKVHCYWPSMATNLDKIAKRYTF